MARHAPEILTKEEVDALMDVVREESRYYYVLFSVAKFTGRRLGEIYGLKVMDVDFENKTLKTLIFKRKQRVVKEAVMIDQLAFILNKWINYKKLKLTDYLFHEDSVRTIQNKIKKFAKMAGIKKNVTFHNFRHHFITQLEKKGWTAHQIIQLTGHSNIGGLAPYSHMVLQDVKEEALKTLKDL